MSPDARDGDRNFECHLNLWVTKKPKPDQANEAWATISQLKDNPVQNYPFITVTIQIGNSDDKLTQKDWAHCVAEAKLKIEEHAGAIHFFGGSDPSAPWQNVCWVIQIQDIKVQGLQNALKNTANAWKQDEIAWTAGETTMLSGTEVSP